MGRDHRRRSQPKRRFRQIEEEEETVDDLAHAAQFAVFPAPAVAATSFVEGAGAPTKEEDDGNEIEVDNGSDNEDSDVSIAGVGVGVGANNDGDNSEEKANSDSDSDSDDESDDDLAEALERMEKASAEEEAKSAKASNPPKTENEVDGYKVPIQELESQLQIQLTVKGGEGTNAAKDNMNISVNEVSLAGKLKNYMIMDRTVVVESITNPPSSSQKAIGPLDEGSLLVVKKPNTADGDDSTVNWIPLGRIFEVFGPVSQPLYTIRLPSQPSKEPTKTSAKSSKTIPAKSKKADSNGDKTKGDGDQNDNSDKNIETAPVVNTESTCANNEEISESTEKKPSETSQSENADASLDTESQESPPNTVETSVQTIENRTVKPLSTDKNLVNDEPETSTYDPWAMDGEYAKFLSQNKDIDVYYIQDEAKIIDTGLVLRTSGKGCDASNIYDEEILDASEAYYSDDEKEREAKNKKKGANRKKRQQGNNGNKHENNPHRSRNFHQQRFHNNGPTPGQYSFRSNLPPPPPPPPQNYGYGQQHTGAGSLPSGFHRMTPTGGFAQQPSSTLYQYPAQSAFHGQGSMPPPPPPPPPNQQYPYQVAGTSSSSSMPPPPPPPRNPNEPPAYQY